MSNDNPSSADPLGAIADEFVEAVRQGQCPSVEEFARRYPAHADEIHEVLPALALMEKAKSAGGGPGQRPQVMAPLRQLGDYQILREVGRGGMGVVYEAQQLSLGRHVAIKVLPSHALLDARQLGRFQREAKAAARLHHTNIVPVFGVGEQEGLHYYVMQFIKGLGLDLVLDELRRLRQSGGKRPPTRGDSPGRPTSVPSDVSAADVARSLLTGDRRQPEAASARTTAPGEPAGERDEGGGRRDEGGLPGASASSHIPPPSSLSSSGTSRLPGQSEGSTLSDSGSQYWQSVARVGMQVADALAHAASQGVLHRDIKPSNLLLDDTGNVWVTDFGLAKADTDGDNLTQTGDIVGTLRYMAPERFNGQGDLRSDIYALGLTLYEMLTLRPAFEEADRNRLIRQVMHEDPVRPRKLNRGVPRDLETVVLKAIARDPAHRYPTPAEMADDLKRFVEDRPVRARRISNAEKLWRWGRRNPLPASLLAVIVVVVLAGFTGVFWQLREAEKQQREAEKQARIAATQEQEARQEAEKARKASEFLVSILQISEKNTQGGNTTARQILADAERRIPVEFADQPDLREDLMAVIEKVKRGIARAAPQAMILEARGTVRLQSATGADKASGAQALANLDDRLTLAPDAEAQLVFLSDFHKEWVKPDREVTITPGGCEPADAVLKRDDGILMTFVPLPKGTFYMGWDGRTKGVRTEIKEDFEIAAYDVTQGQWQAVMGNNPSWFSRQGNGRLSLLDVSDEELKLFPVEMVSWEDAKAFIKRLNEKERGRGYLYRLPTEEEWEYACRGGSTSEKECSSYFFLDGPAYELLTDQANYNGNFPFGMSPRGKNVERTTRVGAYPPNRLGLCDMHGNVWQWCDDGTVPVGLANRACRGGGWNGTAAACQAGYRDVRVQTDRTHYRGFRLVRVPVR
jgi:serine/threonine protein kinase/formylglycine-generating enzyme required for sulfatase activity